MAVVTRAAAGAARAEKSRVTLPPVTRRRMRKKRNTMVSRVVIGFVVVGALIGYVGIYAQVTMCGYNSAALARQTRQLETENQAVSAQIEALSSPERFAAAAEKAGMVQSPNPIYLSVSGRTKVARAD